MPKVRIDYDTSQVIEANISEEGAEFLRSQKISPEKSLEHPYRAVFHLEVNKIVQSYPGKNLVIQSVLLLEENLVICSLCTKGFEHLGMSFNYRGSPRGLCSDCLELATSFACSQGYVELSSLWSNPQFQILAERS